MIRYIEKTNKTLLSVLSIIKTTIYIMILLVLVAVGIVWAVVSGVLEGQQESLEQSESCVGLVFNAESLACNAGNCSLSLKRAGASKIDPIDGFDVTWSNDANSTTTSHTGDIAIARELGNVEVGFDATKADIRAYFEPEVEDKYYCSLFSAE